MLAGRLAYLPASDDVVLDCSSDGGVAFVDAVSDIDVRRIAEDDVHDTGAFLKLVPEIAADEMPQPVLAVQVTAFVGGGAAVGVAIHHAAVDARAFWRFVEAWAAECRGDCRAAQDPAPSHDRAVIAVPAKDANAKRYLSFLAPNRPKLPPTSIEQIPPRSPTSHEKNLHTERNGNSISKTTSNATATRETYNSTLKNPFHLRGPRRALLGRASLAMLSPAIAPHSSSSSPIAACASACPSTPATRAIIAFVASRSAPPSRTSLPPTGTRGLTRRSRKQFVQWSRSQCEGSKNGPRSLRIYFQE